MTLIGLPACYEPTMATCSLTQSAYAYVNVTFTIKLLSNSPTIFATNKCSMSLKKLGMSEKKFLAIDNKSSHQIGMRSTIS